MRRAGSEAIEWIGAHPAEFLQLVGMRFVHFWCGPLRTPWLAALNTLLIPLATFPLVYYVVSYVEHYPAPLAWMLLLLACHEVQSWAPLKNHNRANPA